MWLVVKLRQEVRILKVPDGLQLRLVDELVHDVQQDEEHGPDVRADDVGDQVRGRLDGGGGAGVQEVDGRPAAEEDDQHAGDEAEDGAERLPVGAVVLSSVEGLVAREDLVGFEAFEAGGR